MKFTIIIDLDQTLISTEQQGLASVEHYDFTLDRITYRCHLRPYLKEFFTFCNGNNLSVYLFSAGSSRYVTSIANYLVANKGAIFKRILTRYDCSGIDSKYRFELDTKYHIFIDDRVEVLRHYRNLHKIIVTPFNKQAVDNDLLLIRQLIFNVILNDGTFRWRLALLPT